MDLKLTLLFLLGSTAAMALPVEEDDDDDGFGVIMSDDDGDDLAEIEATSCSRRSHKVYFDIGHQTYTYRYRACFNNVSQMPCYDSRETLPPYCPHSFRGEDCVEIEWRVYESTKSFEICDRYGRPCQQRFQALSRSDSRGQCTGCAQGAIRLVGGSARNEGRVEFCNRGVWGTVCDDGWGSPDAQVVCRQLGFTTTGAVALLTAAFGRGSGSIWFDDVSCVGTESRLANCRARPIGSHNCGHHEDAGVRCGRVPCKSSEAMAEGAEDCLCVIKKGKKKCTGNKCKSELNS